MNGVGVAVHDWAVEMKDWVCVAGIAYPADRHKAVSVIGKSEIAAFCRKQNASKIMQKTRLGNRILRFTFFMAQAW
jgi:hypothetical protein